MVNVTFVDPVLDTTVDPDDHVSLNSSVPELAPVAVKEYATSTEDDVSVCDTVLPILGLVNTFVRPADVAIVACSWDLQIILDSVWAIANQVKPLRQFPKVTLVGLPYYGEA